MKSIGKFYLLITAALLLLLQGCTIASHDQKHKYWAMQPEMQPLPPVGVVADAGYVSYPLLISRKKLFSSVATCSGIFPVDIEVKVTVKPSEHLLVALPWLIVSGSSAFIIPYRGDNPRVAEFIVKVHGNEVKKFIYDDTKYTWIASLGMFAGALSQSNDEYYVEELIADQFVNSFIIDLHKDEVLLAQIRHAQ